MSNRQYIDTTPGTAFPELREVLPPATWHRGAQRMNVRPEPVTAPSPQPKTYRQRIAERIARSPFTPAAIEVVVREFSAWREGALVDRILRARRNDEDIELLVKRLEDPFLYLPDAMYRRLVALGHIRPR
jgi:hypothetical protein